MCEVRDRRRVGTTTFSSATTCSVSASEGWLAPVTRRTSGDKLALRFVYPSKSVRYEDVQVMRQSPESVYSSTDCTLHLVVNESESWNV